MLALLGWSDVIAADYSLTGFGTIGYAVSNQQFSYLRYIDRRGTLKADSLVGLQGEAQFDPQWGATVQVVASAPRTRDEGAEAQVRWAFVSYRPNNEWLLRVGRLRSPFLINTQNAEVGVTYDHARLPTEVYSLTPVYDLDGGAFSRAWIGAESETNIDGYIGTTKIKYRIPIQRDPTLTIFPVRYVPEKVNFMGVVVTHSSGPLLLRGGVHRGTVTPDQLVLVDGFNPTPFPAPFPFGGTLYTPGNAIKKFDLTILTLGADWHSGDWRISGEYGQRIIKDTPILVGSKSASATVARKMGKWTPYITYARLLSAPETRKIYQDVNATPVPLGAQGPPLFLPATYHQTLADRISVFDQYSTMLGASYNLSATSKIKFEWMRTHVGLASVLLDGDVHNKSFNVFSMSYNFAF